ncbi:hypothetical protein KEG38_10740 [Polyangium jinanense]|uniref:hypothetical protein n=1 Tax=Polyangium jinanense TaxID=2829994 RepID=UPI0023427506|nr:hypothetical protein [Polyangium jinanense]MDC3954328.1 hypothetical protein [Polyangium jinanense]
MQRNTLALLMISLGTLVGCGDAEGVYEEEEGAVEEVAEAIVEGNAIQPNAIQPNAIQPNAIQPNAIQPNALAPSTLSPSSLAALRDPGEAGQLSRLFVRYAVGCALEPSQSFTVTWTDELGVTRTEIYVGQLGLAPSWATGPLDETGQRWVSACIAARTNWYGVTVTLSMRAVHDAIKHAGIVERYSYPKEEGAFWGNLFAPTPYLHSCVYVPNTDYVRSRMRDCAAGHIGTNGIESCGIIERRGSCDAVCDSLDSNNGFRPKCVYDATVSPPRKTTEVVTVFLQ